MTATPEVLVTVTRSGRVECRHRGSVAVVDGGGRLVREIGDPGTVTYMRSAAKPIQALAVVASGAADRFAFTDEELAVMCASHYGEPDHRRVVASILTKVGLEPSALHCGTPPSIRAEIALAQARAGEAQTPLVSDCSGKHAGILAVCIHRGFPVAGYHRPDHPVQRMIRNILAAVSGEPEASIGVGVDGCSVPVFALPLRQMARAYARLAEPSGLPPELAAAARRITGAMTAHPFMLAGTGGFCTALAAAGGGRWVNKLGAEGVYCLGVKEPNLGIALKIEDGALRAVPPAAMRALALLGLLSPEDVAALAEFAAVPNRNDLGEIVGELSGVFSLTVG
ncbi:MAG TPA: asparaginase [Acidobacteriota bacterium]|nr:asparaginase [Acidobacteriota bacterium]